MEANPVLTNEVESNPRLLRQRDIIPDRILSTPITCIGAGAIGSHTVKALAQMGFIDITVFDDDIVEIENLNAQGYPSRLLGTPKVVALREIVREYCDIDITVREERYTGGRFPGVVISAVDNMATRRLIWEEHAAKAVETLVIVDPRMSAEHAFLLTMHPMHPKDQESYQKSLYSDEDSLPEPCTAKATIYTALLLSGMVCKAIKDTLTKATANYPRVLAWNIRENDFSLFSPVTKYEDTIPDPEEADLE